MWLFLGAGRERPDGRRRRDRGPISPKLNHPQKCRSPWLRRPSISGKLAAVGVIFCSFSEAVQDHPELVRQYLGSVVPYSDSAG